MRSLPCHVRSTSLVVIGCVQRKITRACRWSCRFSPTPASAWTTGMPNALQQRGRADARELQQLRRLQRARGEDHLAPRRRPRTRGRAGGSDAAWRAGRRTATRVACASVSTRRLRAAARGPQVRHRGRAAPAAARRELVVAGAFLRRAVEIVVARNAELVRAPAIIASTSACGAPMSDAHSGPSAPCYSLAPRTLCSSLRNHGSTSA